MLSWSSLDGSGAPWTGGCFAMPPMSSPKIEWPPLGAGAGAGAGAGLAAPASKNFANRLERPPSAPPRPPAPAASLRA